VLYYVGRGLLTGCYLVQRVLPDVYIYVSEVQKVGGLEECFDINVKALQAHP
jgi:hypothetical protein